MKSSSMYAFVFGFFSLYINKVFEIHPCFAWINSLFPFIAEMYSIEWMYHDLLILSSVDGHLGCFQLGLLRKMLLWVLVQVFLWACAFASVGCKSRSGIAGACISCTFTLLEAAWLPLANGPPKRRRDGEGRERVPGGEELQEPQACN